MCACGGLLGGDGVDGGRARQRGAGVADASEENGSDECGASAGGGECTSEYGAEGRGEAVDDGFAQDVVSADADG